jgi:hypothetical protein
MMMNDLVTQLILMIENDQELLPWFAQIHPMDRAQMDFGFSSLKSAKT